jgi:serine/threonine protein kinase
VQLRDALVCAALEEDYNQQMGQRGHEPEQFGKYTVVRPLGAGGMSTVHLAEVRDQPGPRRSLALKRLSAAAAARATLRQSFIDEARLMSYLHHPNIVETFEAGKIRDTYYIAMEHVPGPALKELIEHCKETIGLIPAAITLSLAAQICDALDHAHHRCDEHGAPLGIIHRDVSPANVLVSETGLAKLIDFGLAKARSSTANTGEGVIKGKFNYVAPEYLGGKLDARADLWAVGVIMYEMLTSRRLFDAPDDFETLARVRKLPIPRPSRANPLVSETLDEIVMRALEREPRRRWQTAAQLRDALNDEIARPGNAVDNDALAEWVRWVFTQEPGTEKSGISMLAEIAEAPIELDALDIDTITTILEQDAILLD